MVDRCGFGRLGLFRAGRHGDPFARLRDVGGTVGAGQQPVVAPDGDFLKGEIIIAALPSIGEASRLLRAGSKRDD
jgi:hypothetical protein